MLHILASMIGAAKETANLIQACIVVHMVEDVVALHGDIIQIEK